MATITRRSFMDMVGQAGVVGLSRSLFPAWMPRLAFRGEGRSGAPGDVLVAIFQRGGMDGLSVVVPYGDSKAYYDKRPTISVPAPGKGDGTAIDLDGHFGLHPALRPLKDIFDAKHLAIVHATGSPDPSRSHFDAMDYMERGTPGDKMISTGWINRHLQTAAWQNDSPFRAVGMGTMVQGSLRGPISALALKSIADFHLGGRDDQLAGIQDTLARLYSIDAPGDALDTQAGEVFSAMKILGRLAAATYTPEKGAAYPDSDFGRGLKQTAQLIKADVGLEVSCIDIGGWDTHEEQGSVQGHLPTILAELGQGLSAFYTDLGERVREVTVVTMSEFGRRAEENASKGTDHGHGNCMFVMGGGVNGGVYTRWPGLADDQLDNGDLAITTDYRDVLAEILTLRLLNPALDQVFPGYKPNSLGILQRRRT
jgi:uncharacterized protein (DUF1501 family)